MKNQTRTGGALDLSSISPAFCLRIFILMSMTAPSSLTYTRENKNGTH